MLEVFIQQAADAVDQFHHDPLTHVSPADLDIVGDDGGLKFREIVSRRGVLLSVHRRRTMRRA